MKTIKITKTDLSPSSEYITSIGSYNNPEDVNVEIDSNLGYVKFEGIYVKGSITALRGSGIKAGLGIKAGSGIKAGLGIKAGWGIKAGSGIKAGWGIKAGLGIEAGLGIKAGYEIKAGLGIEAGDEIEAGWGIEAGLGIASLYSYVKAKLNISVNPNCTIVAGCFSTSGRNVVEAQEIIGNVAYGEVKLLPKDNKQEVAEIEDVITLNGKSYKLIKEM